jgi:7-cyano-7-deazaguanine reductase
MTEPKRRGTLAIEQAQLEPVPNPNPERDYLIHCVMPEFTCLCPRSGFPDFATLRLWYVPGPSIVELKSLKLWLNAYRDRHAFHEAVINDIVDELATLLETRWIKLVGDFNVRGNIKTVVTVVRALEGYTLPAELRLTLNDPSSPTL